MNSALFYVDQAGKILHAENSETVLTAWEGAHLDDILSPVYRAISFRKVMQDMSLRDDRYCTIVFEVNLESVKRTVAMQLSISFVEKDIHLVILEEYKMDEFSITLDGNGKIKSCGGNSESFFGYEEKEMETVGLLALFGMDQQEFDELVKNEKNRNLTGRHKNGQTFYLNANVRKKSFIGTCMTILKLTKVNPKLEAVFVLDSTGKVESFSEVIFNLLFGSDAELNGKEFSSLVTLNEEEKMISSDNGRDPKRRRLNMEGKKEDFSFREGKCTRTFLGTIKHEDGSPIPVQIEFYSFINEKGDKKSVIKMRRSLMKTSKFYGKWEIGEKLGSGNGGKVKAVRHVDTGKRAAVKIIKKKDLNEKDVAEKVKKESEIMMLLSHSNIVQLYEVLETEKELMIVMELVEGGMDLSEYTKKRGDFSESAAREIFRQILQAIHYCHSKQIFHRDIKHANILVNDKNEVRVIDFGLSRTIENGYLTTYCGTLAYSAPEMILGKKYKGSHIDVWSLGVVFFTLISGGSYPFDLISEILTPKSYTIPKGISDHCRDLIERMLESDCEKRISLSEILSHPWFAEETKPIQENPS